MPNVDAAGAVDAKRGMTAGAAYSHVLSILTNNSYYHHQYMYHHCEWWIRVVVSCVS